MHTIESGYQAHIVISHTAYLLDKLEQACEGSENEDHFANNQ